MNRERSSLSFTLVACMAVFGFVLTAALFRFAMPRGHEFSLGPAARFPPAAVPYPIDLGGSPAYLANTGDEILVFHWRTPATTRCRYRWAEYEFGDYPELSRAEAFLDPCSGARFALDGRCIFGPAERGLDRFPVRLIGGQIYVDLSRVIRGPANPLMANEQIAVGQ